VSASFETTSGVRRRYAAAVIAREVLRDVALACAAQRIPVMPLKGVFFQLFLYPDPAARLISDVDVLVPEGAFEAAIGALLAAGFRPLKAGHSLVEVSLQSPRGLPVDLHRRLFSRGRYRLDTAGVFRRSQADSALLGVPLQLAHPLDTAAHQVGKFASDHVLAQAEPRLRELALICAHYELAAGELADHLVRHGLARAARDTLARAFELTRQPFFARVLESLPASRVAALCCGLARSTSGVVSETSVLAAVSAHLLNSSLPRAAASLAFSSSSRLHHALWSRTGGRGAGILRPFFAKGAHAGREG
jgi:hypothetical protein